MTGDEIKLTVYCGESRRRGDALVCDLLLDLFERHQIAVSILMRGMAGFGLRHQLHTDNLLTLSEDLPLVLVAVDERERIERLLPELHAIISAGLATLERAQLVRDSIEDGALDDLDDTGRLTVYSTRGARIQGRPAYRTVVEILRAHGIAGTTVLLGLDGTVNGSRRRGRFFARNLDVPLSIMAVGETRLIAAAVAALLPLAPEVPMTLESVDLCKTGGRLVAGSPSYSPLAVGDGASLQMLTVLSGEQDRFDGRPLHLHLITELRASRIAGATALRGVWGYSHDGPPHTDHFLALRRHVPVTTIVVDRAERIRDAFAIVDRATVQAGVVTCGRVERASGTSREP